MHVALSRFAVVCAEELWISAPWYSCPKKQVFFLLTSQNVFADNDWIKIFTTFELVHEIQQPWF